MMIYRDAFERDNGLIFRLTLEAAKRGQANAASSLGRMMADAKPAEAAYWLFRAWAGKTASPDPDKAWGQAVAKLNAEQRQALLPYFITVARRIDLPGFESAGASGPPSPPR
jgi:hypothetical protein